MFLIRFFSNHFGIKALISETKLWISTCMRQLFLTSTISLDSFTYMFFFSNFIPLKILPLILYIKKRSYYMYDLPF